MISKAERDELRRLLVTCDGKGKDAKDAAVTALLDALDEAEKALRGVADNARSMWADGAPVHDDGETTCVLVPADEVAKARAALANMEAGRE